MTERPVVPEDSRYVPLQQQPYCCCPATIQMVMLRHGIPLLPAELIGWHLGVVVPPEDAGYFYNPRISETRPRIGYGTQLGDGIDANEAFQEMGVPLSMELERIDSFPDFPAFKERLYWHYEQDHDILLCVLWGDVCDIDFREEPFNADAAHIVLVDRIYEGSVRLIDAARGRKWREYDMNYLYNAMVRLGVEKDAGLWILKKTGKRK